MMGCILFMYCVHFHREDMLYKERAYTYSVCTVLLRKYSFH
jgi:hypothetical protein